MRFTLLALMASLALVAAWTKEDHEIFRLKDELERFEGSDVTFYDFLSVSPSASQDEINKAYRKRSKLLHPDKAAQSYVAERATSSSKAAASSSKSAAAKSSGANKPKPTSHVAKPPTDRELRAATKRATERFTRLGLIANILRGSGRARYDHFLANGFPAWRGADYYYARFRPGLGTVLLSLFIVAGGGAHYIALVIGWKRQRDFVERYIQQARKLAWGESSSVAGIPGIETAGTGIAATSALPPVGDDGTGTPTPMNRRDRRNQEKQNKKPSAATRRAAQQQQQQRSGTNTPQDSSQTPDPFDVASGSLAPVPGPKKRVQAENGKVLVVDSAGNVFLEELVAVKDDDDEDEEGGKRPQLFLLDPNEIAYPTFRQTILWQLPAWVVTKAQSVITRQKAEVEELEEEGPSKAAIAREKVRSKAKGKLSKRVEEQDKAAAAAAASLATSSPDGADSSEVDGFVDVRDVKLDESEAAKWADDKDNGNAAATKKRRGKTR